MIWLLFCQARFSLKSGGRQTPATSMPAEAPVCDDYPTTWRRTLTARQLRQPASQPASTGTLQAGPLDLLIAQLPPLSVAGACSRVKVAPGCGGDCAMSRDGGSPGKTALQGGLRRSTKGLYHKRYKCVIVTALEERLISSAYAPTLAHVLDIMTTQKRIQHHSHIQEHP